MWVWWGAGLFAALNALKPLSIYDFTAIVAGNTLAWLAGFIAVFSPAGIGVREIILTALIAGHTGQGVAALAAVTARLFTIISELTGAFLSGSLRKTVNNLIRHPDEC